MVSDYPEVRPQGSASTHIHQVPSNVNFTEQPHGSFMGPEPRRTQHQFFSSNNQQSPRPTVSGSYMGPELGRTHPLFISNHQQSPIPSPHPRPLLHYVHGMHDAIQREIEKEQIREQIIMSEIVRRRELEAEVRRELMMEWRGRDGLPFAPPSLMGFGSTLRPPVVETRGGGRYVEEKIILSPAERERLYRRHESGVVESLPFQRGSAEVRISDVKPDSDGAKENIILLATPSENISGVKREAPAGESPSESNSRKKLKEDWSCALCRVSTTSEQALKEHLQGKKHKAKEAGLRAQSSGKNYRIGLFPKKAAKPTPDTDNVAPPCLPLDDKASLIIRDQPLSEEQPNSEKFEQNKKPVVGQEMQSSSNHPKRKFRFSCEVCQIGCHSLKILNAHLAGKKHKGRVAIKEQNRRDEKNDAVDENNEEDGGAVDESGPEEANPKVQHDGQVKEDATGEDCGAVVVNEPVGDDLTKVKDVDKPSPVEVETMAKDVNGRIMEEAAADDGRSALVNEPDLKAGVGGEPEDSEPAVS